MEEHYLSSDFVLKDYRQYRLAKELGHIFLLKINEAASFHHQWKEKQRVLETLVILRLL
jgi:Zn-dependent peptidase ImmA (M78 family)